METWSCEKLGKLESVKIRKVWNLETDFSDWIAEKDRIAEDREIGHGQG